MIGISNYLMKKAAATAGKMISNGQVRLNIFDEKGFFVTSSRNIEEGEIHLKLIKVGDTDIYICAYL